MNKSKVEINIALIVFLLVVTFSFYLETFPKKNNYPEIETLETLINKF